MQNVLLFRTRTAFYTKNKYSLPGTSQPKSTIHCQSHFSDENWKEMEFFNRSYLRPNSKLRDSTISHYFVWIGWIYLFLFFLLISLFLHLISFFFIQEQFFEARGLRELTRRFDKINSQIIKSPQKILETIWNFLLYCRFYLI